MILYVKVMILYVKVMILYVKVMILYVKYRNIKEALQMYVCGFVCFCHQNWTEFLTLHMAPHSGQGALKRSDGLLSIRPQMRSQITFNTPYYIRIKGC